MRFRVPLRRVGPPMTRAARERAQVRVPILVVSAAAWVLIVAGGGGHGVASHVHAHAGLAATPVPPAVLQYVWPQLGGWALMLVAMMLPLLLAPVCHVRDRSFARRRGRAISLFLAGYGAIWMAAAVLLLTIVQTLALASASTSVPASASAMLVAITAIIWQCSPLKQRCLNHGHAHPSLAAAGRDADRDVLRFGLIHGFSCIGSCWALMLLPILLPQAHVIAMAAVTLWLIAERMESPAPARWRVRIPTRLARLTLAQASMFWQHCRDVLGRPWPSARRSAGARH